ncbi:MAG TPA: glycosyltransferase family 2 protein [Pyrinomonadaceae bacterium]|nr:glycosyltransferase family 2 protein [Pyrinomonadaceae bacterium]
MVPVSICLTTFNRAAVLPPTLDSILVQTFGDFELIISDDCSTDETRDVCEDYRSRDRRIRYFRNAKNLSMPGNLNAAISKASGDYIANLHDGDVYRVDLIARWKEALDSETDTPFVFNAYKAKLSDGSVRLFCEPFTGRIPGEYIGTHYFRTLTSCVWGTVMARASTYREHGQFDSRFGFISDVDMWLRLVKRSAAAYVSEPLITIAEREPNHPFAHQSWQHLFWQFGIYYEHVNEYRSLYPGIEIPSPSDETVMRRRVLLKAMLSLIRSRQWDRVQEGLAIWRDSDDPLLKTAGIMFGRPQGIPGWYDRRCWISGRTCTADA